MIMKETVATFIDLFYEGISCERKLNDNNSNKFIRTFYNVVDRLHQVNPEIILVAESGWSDRRPFALPNIGSLMESLLKAVLDGEKENEYSKQFDDKKADCKRGWCEYEIKSCMGLTSLNTKVQKDKPIILINEKGVFTIQKKDIDEYLSKNGKFPYNKAVGKPIATVMKKLGY